MARTEMALGTVLVGHMGVEKGRRTEAVTLHGRSRLPPRDYDYCSLWHSPHLAVFSHTLRHRKEITGRLFPPRAVGRSRDHMAADPEGVGLQMGHRRALSVDPIATSSCLSTCQYIFIR